MQQPPSGGKTKLTELTYEEQLQIKTRRRRDREREFLSKLKFENTLTV